MRKRLVGCVIWCVRVLFCSVLCRPREVRWEFSLERGNYYLRFFYKVMFSFMQYCYSAYFLNCLEVKKRSVKISLFDLCLITVTLVQQTTILHVQTDAVTLPPSPSPFPKHRLPIHNLTFPAPPPSKISPPNPQNNRHPRPHPLPPRACAIQRPSCHPRYRGLRHARAGTATGPPRADLLPRRQERADGVVHAEFRVSDPHILITYFTWPKEEIFFPRRD